MAARSTKAQALNPDEIDSLRQQLADGKRPRVALSGPQFPDGSSGTVSRIGDPEVEGADFITVRVKVNGVTDELAFAPSELSVRRAARANARVAKPARRVAKPSRLAVAPERTTPARVAAPVAPPTAKPITSPAAKPAAPPATKPAAKPVAKALPKPAGRPAAGAGRRRKPASPPKVSFTVTSSGASWTLSATRGAKGIVKGSPVSPGAVTALADLLDQPNLVEAVAEINETAWAEAQTRADQLRAELDQLEAVLATHRSPG